jgi:hypothetical protein
MSASLPEAPPRARTKRPSISTATLLISLSLYVTPAAAKYGYCFTQGLLGGTKVFIHDAVHEAEFMQGDVADAYRAQLKDSHRFRFGSITCPSFGSEAEALEDMAATRTLALHEGFAEFVFPVHRD